VPIAGILIGCVTGLLATLAQLYLRQDVFTLLASTSGGVQLVVLLIVALAQIRQRRKLEAEGVRLRLKMWLFPWLSYAVIAGIGGVLILLAFTPDDRLMFVMSTVTVLVVLGALGLRNGHYRYFRYT
jgi:GABA permease